MHNLEYSLDRQATIIFGIGFASIGALVLVIGVLIMPNGEPGFFLPWVLLLFFMSIIFFTAKSVVRINPNTKRLMKTTGAFCLFRSRLYNFSGFHEIQVRRFIIGVVDDQNPTSLYYIRLVGEKDLAIPGTSCGLGEAFRKAQEITSLTGLPISIRPTT